MPDSAIRAAWVPEIADDAGKQKTWGLIIRLYLFMERSGLMFRVWRDYRREVLIIRKMEE
jgi:hypothetical protein